MKYLNLFRNPKHELKGRVPSLREEGFSHIHILADSDVEVSVYCSPFVIDRLIIILNNLTFDALYHPMEECMALQSRR